jgi:CubicO group peptidase (beta-lactamase class C family)
LSRCDAGLEQNARLTEFIDAFFTREMRELRVPGAVFVLVERGEVILKKGYGLAQIETAEAVDPDRTVFRVASISKLVTAFCALRLAELGQLELDRDVNAYLTRFQLPANGLGPVTAIHLLAHTAGFDERRIGIAVRSPAELLPLVEYLARRMPPRVRPPGEAVSYSNHGYALLGHLIECVGGAPFAQHAAQQVLQPLGMRSSTFLQPPPDEIAKDLATGYEQGPRPVPLEWFQDSPAASLLSTGADMSKLIAACLRDQSWRGLLSAFRELPAAVPGRPAAGPITFGGRCRGFASLIWLWPEREIGFFVASNTVDSELRDRLVKSFLAHYLPDLDAPQALPRAPFQVSPDPFMGVYRHVRDARSNIEKIVAPFGDVQVGRGPDGGLEGLTPAGPLLFVRQADGQQVEFRLSPAGGVRYMVVGQDFYEKLRWHETTAFHLGLLVMFAGAFVSTLIASLSGAGIRDPNTEDRPLRWARRVASWLSGLNLAFLGALAACLADVVRGGFWEFQYGVPPALVLTLCLPLAGVGLVPVFAVLTLLAWWRRAGSLLARLHLTLVFLAAAAFLPFLAFWNFLGFRF